MKVVLGILVLLHCAAEVVQLSCYTCPETSDESICTITICGFSEIVCKNTYKRTGTGPTATYSVSKTCATSETCIPKLDALPLVFCCIISRCNVQLICFTCDETTDESSCTPGRCAAGAFCQSDYKLNGAGVPVVTKSCAADCKAVDNTADKNVRTTCCKTGFCNENALSCNTCTNEADEPKCAATACAAADTRCQSTYTLTAPDVPVSKACAQDCTPSATVKCCGTSQCNVDLLKCYTCTDLTDESKCKDITVCGFGDKFCKTTYKLTGTGVTVSKGCASTCTVTTAFPRDECCQGKLCNVQTLSCFTCAAGTDEASCTLITNCGAGETWCFSTFIVSGSTITVEKGCAPTCVPDPQTFCCTTNDCNAHLICLTCDETDDESFCTPSPCAAEAFCKSDYKLNGAGVPVVTKSCAADCKAVDNTADKNVRTTCCKTGYCNGNALSCNTCTNEADEPKCAATACAATDKLCQSTYTLTAPGKLDHKGKGD
ncbi:uncharacterized protein LOC117398236 [Acipenser ruthenus]|uniref:uncharacterized protein LOC117398236 n=1 Tax=Acipenser ruthenus TaxID=7906 RepID=UPI002740B40D|nr:uncharacterized protein LOC117398236 [Acipenser ruthenus]